MSILSRSISNEMGTTSFHDFKKQASFFFKEKIKTARLALTDVTPAQLLTEEAVNGNPDAKTLGSISRAAFDLDDYWRIVGILHKRLLKFEKKNWRVSYNSLIVLEHLLTHGPESVAEEFQCDKDGIREMKSFQYVDESGFNWGLAVRRKSELIVRFLEEETVLREERNRARKLTREIRGFGSFVERSSTKGVLLESSSFGGYGRSNSQFNSRENQPEAPQRSRENLGCERENRPKNSESWEILRNGVVIQEAETEEGLKENVAPVVQDLHRWNETAEEENNSLLCGEEDQPRNGIPAGNHPFEGTDHQTTESLLSG